MEINKCNNDIEKETKDSDIFNVWTNFIIEYFVLKKGIIHKITLKIFKHNFLKYFYSNFIVWTNSWNKKIEI